MENNNFPQKSNSLEVQKLQNEHELSLRNKDLDKLKIERSTEVITKGLEKVDNISKSISDSQISKNKTKVELARIIANHDNIKYHIDTEYSKQKHAMDKASDVVDYGLEKENLAIIALGLESLTSVANTNPLANLKKSLDEEIDKSLEGDDFMIEI